MQQDRRRSETVEVKPSTTSSILPPVKTNSTTAQQIRGMRVF